eukprot:CAMPEP_0194534696 /NCGR_PEP_ID=MMETSP0253-20130528/72999_1 /TAXON_ID=2966 /ORGANISM="Noctiluca scintillans" /LENGTH=188 /DNA_ID=CAMNT_0039380395 /DNA_START=740 /DNA_END=1306 /DNA_ORIENTATION=+
MVEGEKRDKVRDQPRLRHILVSKQEFAERAKRVRRDVETVAKHLLQQSICDTALQKNLGKFAVSRAGSQHNSTVKGDFGVVTPIHEDLGHLRMSSNVTHHVRCKYRQAWTQEHTENVHHVLAGLEVKCWQLLNKMNEEILREKELKGLHRLLRAQLTVVMVTWTLTHHFVHDLEDAPHLFLDILGHLV